MRVLCDRGALVIGAARTLEGATQGCARVPGKTIPIGCDLCEPASVRGAVRSVAQLDRPLDAIIANARPLRAAAFSSTTSRARRATTRGAPTGQSKLANLLFTTQLARRLPRDGQTANAVHPGVIRTSLQRHLGPTMRAAFSTLRPLFMKNVALGAATQCFVAVHPVTASVRGEYFVDCNVAQPSRAAQDATLAARLWEKTEDIIAGLR